MRRFLEEGDKVKVNIRFRGREMSHQELGREMAARIEADLGEDIVIESRPRLEGRQMVMMIAPKKKLSARGAQPVRDDPATVEGACGRLVVPAVRTCRLSRSCAPVRNRMICKGKPALA